MNYWLLITLGFFVGHALSSFIYFLWAARHIRILNELLHKQIQIMEASNMMLGTWIEREQERDNL